MVVAQVYITDARDEKDRAAAQGRMSAEVSAGLVLGPVIGGFLAQAGGNFLLGMSAAAASGLGALWILLAVPSQSPPVKASAATDSPQSVPPNREQALSLLKEGGELRPLFVVAVIGWFALACLAGTFGRLIQHKPGYGQMEFGILLSIEALLWK